MNIRVSTADGVPLYLQIVNQVKFLAASGKLKAGEELPPVRTLAERLVLNPNTVARAYRELEAAGVVVTRRGAGTYVSDAGSQLARKAKIKILTERIDALLADAAHMRIETDEVVQLLHRRAEVMGAGGKEKKA